MSLNKDLNWDSVLRPMEMEDKGRNCSLLLLGKSMKNGEALGIKSGQETRLGLAWRRVCEFVCAHIYA